MKEFNPNATCSKCGHDDIEGKFKRAWKPDAIYIAIAEMDGKEVVSKPDRIQRTCTRCGYKWDEAPITSTTPVHDAVKEAVELAKPIIAFEVGDKITVKDHSNIESSTICYVTEIREGGQIGFKPSTTHFIGQESVAKRVELVEKGAKVMTFKGVVPQRYVSDGLVLSNIAPFGWDEDNAKAYTLTMVEDK